MKNILARFEPAKTIIAALLISVLPLRGNAHADTVAVSNPLTSMPKVVVRLSNGNTVKGSVTGITDSTIMLDIHDQADEPNTGSYATPTLYGSVLLPVKDIKYVRVKRNAFLSGFAIGGLIGYGLGYGAGYITHKDDDLKDYDQNKEDAKARGVGMGIVGAASLGLVGGIIGPVVLRKRFVIDGKKENMQRLIKVLMNVL